MTRAKVGGYIIVSRDASCYLKALKDHGVFRIDDEVNYFLHFRIAFSLRVMV